MPLAPLSPGPQCLLFSCDWYYWFAWVSHPLLRLHHRSDISHPSLGATLPKFGKGINTCLLCLLSSCELFYPLVSGLRLYWAWPLPALICSGLPCSITPPNVVPRLEEEIIIENVPKGLGKLNEIIEGKGLGYSRGSYSKCLVSFRDLS